MLLNKVAELLFSNCLPTSYPWCLHRSLPTVLESHFKYTDYNHLPKALQELEADKHVVSTKWFQIKETQTLELLLRKKIELKK